MPAGRFRRYKRTKQPRARKKIDRKQNRQIAKIKRALYTKVYTRVAVNGANIGHPISATLPPNNGPVVYISPISPAMCQGRFAVDSTTDNEGIPLNHTRLYDWGSSAVPPTNQWAYDPGQPNQGIPPSVNSTSTNLWLAGSSACTKHCKIRYRFQCNSKDTQEVCLAVLSPRKDIADSVVRQCRLKKGYGLIGGSGACSTSYEPVSPGSQCQFLNNVDYTYSGNGVGVPAPDQGNLNSMFGVAFNPQRWKVHYKRYVKMQDTQYIVTNDASLGANTVTPVATDMDKNPREVWGSISLPMNAYVRGQPAEPALTGSTDGTLSTRYATSATYPDYQNEDAMIMVVISSAAVASPATAPQLHPIQMDYTQTFTHHLYSTTMKKME